MKQETKDKLPEILERIGHRGGETVPEGYFDDFRRRMKESLPERQWEYEGEDGRNSIRRTFWQKVRPYAYLAAMFLGIWCMMNMFDMVRSGQQTTIDDNPTLLAALGNETFYNDYIISDVDDYDLYDELYETGFEPSELLQSDN